MKNIEFTALISIIVPVYNTEKYLPKCIQSIQNQNYKNIEIILVNDGSKDKSGEICDKYKETDARIKVIHKANEGLGFARNSGLDVAKGNYIIFVDSDDYVDDDMVMNLIKPVEQLRAEVVVGGFQRFKTEGIFVHTDQYTDMLYEGSDVMELLFARMLGSSPEKSDVIKMSVDNVLYSMEIINKYKLRFVSERVFISEDLIFNSDFFPHVQRAVTVSSVSYKYRKNENSLTTSYRADRFDQMIILYLEMRKRIISFGMSRSSLHRLQKQTFANIRYAIRKEAPRFSGKSYINSINSIRRICCNSVVCDILSDYPMKQLGFRQKIFVFMLKKRMATTLMILSESKMLN